MESHGEIEERAAVWLARREEDSWSAADEAELNAWLEASTAHKVAFVRLEAGWQRTRRMKALGAGGQVGVVPPPGQWNTSVESEPLQRSSLSRLGTKFLSVRARTASILAVFVVSAVWFFQWSTGPTYATPVGGTASVPMKDGSNVTLNTDSAIRVALSAKQREVRLDHGEAFFEVAKDPSRPFVVVAGDQRVIAVGTKFSVRRIDNEIRVFVTEGKVRIEDGSASALPPAPQSATPEPASRSAAVEASRGQVFVAAGGIARASQNSILVQRNALPEIENYLSWRSGYLIFTETALAEAVAEFNRYNDRKIVIADPEVAAIRIGGKFRATNVDVFVRLLTDGYPIDAQSSGDRIIFRDRRPR